MGLSSFFKNLFGSAKETSSDVAVKVEDAFEQAKEEAAPLIHKAETFAEETFAKAKEASEPLLDSAAEYAAQAKDMVSEYVEKASDSISEVIESVKQKAEEFGDNSKTNTPQPVIDLSEGTSATEVDNIDKIPLKE